MGGCNFSTVADEVENCESVKRFDFHYKSFLKLGIFKECQLSFLFKVF